MIPWEKKGFNGSELLGKTLGLVGIGNVGAIVARLARGIEGIDPVPLVSPSEVPPPTELGSQMHFNDWILAYEGG